ncbi:MAG: hypothetical protein P4L58_02935, partial [Candidatus Pacebacteria bacterium]|nr:hypothetical protein [Candidatus Paceibacterota bacterium]
MPGPIAYPWGFPLLLAPIYAALGLNLIALKLPGLFCFLGFLVCLYLLARKSLPKIESVFVAAIFAFHPFLLGYLDQILSDIPYLFVSTLSLLYFYSLNTERRTSVIQAATFSLLMFFSLFTRTAGFTLLIGYLLVRALDAWRLRHKPAQLRNIAHEMFLILSITGTVLLASNFLLPSFLTESSYS